MKRAARGLLGGAAVIAALAAWHVADRGATRSETLRDAVLDLDSRVVLRPRIACEPRVAQFSVLAAGSAPRLDAEARFVWFEARGPDARRQLHRIERATRALECLTCSEPGNNRRPAPHPTGRAVLFDTDRFASGTRPFDRELMVLAADGPLRPSRRLTWDAARDTHALYDPSGLGVVWSHTTLVGRALRAPIRLGHGSLTLGRGDVIVRGGFAAVRPLAWSADARAFAFASGRGPFERASLTDFASGSTRVLPAASAFDASISFSADGSLLARAEHAAEGATRVWLGDTDAAPSEIALGAELAAWGAPAGLALAPDGDAFALAQTRAGEERIVWAELACARGATP